MLLVGMLLAVASPTPAARDISAFCNGRPACIAEQRESLRYFLDLWVVFDASKADAERCMRAGKGARYIDWTVSVRCMRVWSKGRRSMLPGGRPG